MKKISIKEFCDILLIAVFCMAILTPLITTNTIPGKVSAIENKTLVAFPHFRNPDSSLNRSYFQQMNDFLNDNVGFKQEAILYKIATSYKIFKKFDVPNFIMGENEQVYHNNGGTQGILAYQGDDHYSQTELKYLTKQIQYADNYFTQNGINFIVMAIPNKENVYPEDFTKTVNRFSNKSRVDLFIEYLENNSNVNVLSMKDTLINSKGKGLLYYKNYDPVHWNMRGAFIGYTELMKTIKQYYTNIKVLNDNDFEITKTKSKGSLFYFDYDITNRAMNFDDTIYTYNLKSGYKSVPSNEVPIDLSIDLNCQYVNYHNDFNKEAPRILIIGDSFIMPLLPMMSESFSNLYFTRMPQASEVMKLIDITKPDIVVLEFVERTFSIDVVKQLTSLTIANQIGDMQKVGAEKLSYNIDTPQFNNGTINVNTSQDSQDITGWILDNSTGDIGSQIFLKVNDKYYIAQRVARPDVSDYYKNPKYLNSGFTLSIPVKELIGLDSVELVILPEGDQNKYTTIGISIKTQ